MSKTYSAGIVTAYGAAKRAGYQGTYEDFCRQQAGYADSAAAVETAKNTAVSAANTATTKAVEATTAATDAQTAKTQTEAAASQALTDIGAARSGAISAVQTEGVTQTANATAQAQAAAQSATTASTKASEASASATSAGQSATNAAASATSAANAASAAQGVLESIPQDYTDLSEDVEQLKADLADVLDLQSSSSSTRNPINWANGYMNGTTGVFGNDTQRLRSGFLSGNGKDYTVTIADGFVLERIGEYSSALQNSFVQFLTNGLESLTSVDVTLSQGKYYVFQIRKDPIAAISASDVESSTVVLTNYELHSERLETIEETLSDAVSDIESVTADMPFVKDVIGYNEVVTWNTGYIKTVAVGATATLERTAFGTLSSILVPCKKGQRFIINGLPRDNVSTRPYMFVDGDNVCVYVSGEITEMTDYEIISPVDGKLIVNLYNTQVYTVITGTEGISEGIRNLENIVGVSSIDFTDGYYIPTKSSGQTLDGLTPTSNANMTYAIVDCYKRERFVISGTPTSNSGRAMYMFIDANNKVLERGSADGVAVNNKSLTAPEAGKLVINFLVSNPHMASIQFTDMGKTVSENESTAIAYNAFMLQPLTKLPEYIFNTMAYKPLGALDKGYMVLVTDDGCEDGTLGVCSFTIPLAIEKNVPFTFSLMSTSDVFTNDTWTATLLDAIENHGCSVAQHGVRRFSTYSEQELVQFFDTEKAFFDAKGIELHGAVCPAHTINKMVMAVAGGRFGVVRSGYFGGTAEDKVQYNGIDLSNICDYYTSGANSNKYGLSCFNIASKTLAYSKDAIDYAYDNKKILIALYHEFSSDLPDAAVKQKIADVIDYAKTKGLTFITLGDIEKLPFANQSTW